LKIFSIEKKEFKIVVTLFGKSILKFTTGRGVYNIKGIVEKYAGVKTNIKKWDMQHGRTPFDFINDSNPNIEIMFGWNKRYKDAWEKDHTTPCEIITAPFVMYRRMKKIEKKPDAKGTIAYPVHSTFQTKAEYDIDEYCNMLRSLPEEFQPVTISVHPADVQCFGLDKEYQKRGFKTVTSSVNSKRKFYEQFYDNLCSHKYATSNEPGSYTFYAVEAGIPFFILGSPCVIDNTSGKDAMSEAKIFTICDYKWGKYTYDLFSQEPFGVITPEQKEFVESELGVNDGLSKEELKNILKKVGK